MSTKQKTAQVRGKIGQKLHNTDRAVYTTLVGYGWAGAVMRPTNQPTDLPTKLLFAACVGPLVGLSQVLKYQPKGYLTFSLPLPNSMRVI